LAAATEIIATLLPTVLVSVFCNDVVIFFFL
jgi:hypothetical protein